MQKVLRNTPPPQKKSPETLENTRPPEEYTDAVVKNYNERYKALFGIDGAKARLQSVRQDSFKPEMAHVTLAEDILDDKGKIVSTIQRSAKITREAYPRAVVIVKRDKGETPYVTWGKVEEAAGLEKGELVGDFGLSTTATKAVYKISPMSLNHYGEVRVKFEYEEEAPVGP